MSAEFECDCKVDFCNVFQGNVLNLDIKKNDCEVRADLTIDKKRCVRIWGQIKDCDGCPEKNVLVKLVKVCYICGKIEYQGFAHAVSDCLGFYQFDICAPDDDCKFIVIASKPTKVFDRVIKGEEICDVCCR